MDSKVLELVLFELKPEVEEDVFLNHSLAVSSWAETQPGFLSRDLTKAEDGRWVDVVWWRSMADAKQAAEAAMSSDACSPMFSAIAEKSVQMIHATSAKTAA